MNETNENSRLKIYCLHAFIIRDFYICAQQEWHEWEQIGWHYNQTKAAKCQRMEKPSFALPKLVREDFFTSFRIFFPLIYLLLFIFFLFRLSDNELTENNSQWTFSVQLSSLSLPGTWGLVDLHDKDFPKSSVVGVNVNVLTVMFPSGLVWNK